jgi:hypothetical protein
MDGRRAMSAPIRFSVFALGPSSFVLMFEPIIIWYFVSAINGRKIVPSLRDSVFLHTLPSAQALG